MVQKGEYNDKSDLVTSLITQLAFVEQTTWSDLSSLIGGKSHVSFIVHCDWVLQEFPAAMVAV